uniref:Uncharacterized protein n=1 Tax=Glossina morsitans morsitans TaxID=37546 RepID=A0A1B0GE64_GLOMM
MQPFLPNGNNAKNLNFLADNIRWSVRLGGRRSSSIKLVGSGNRCGGGRSDRIIDTLPAQSSASRMPVGSVLVPRCSESHAAGRRPEILD